MINVDLDHLLNAIGLATMMRQRMMRFHVADFRVGAQTCLAPQHERNYACEVRLQRQNLQIEHQLGIVALGDGHA